MIREKRPGIRELLAICGLLVWLAGCLGGQEGGSLASSRPWAYTDLRAVEAAGAVQPELDLVAAYIRRLGPEIQVRLDLLDLTDRHDYDLYLALDTGPGGTTELPLQATAELEWDTLLIIPASGPIQALAGAQALAADRPLAQPVQRREMGIRVLRDPGLDTLTISFNPAALGDVPLGFSLQVYLTPAGSLLPADQIAPIHSDERPPERARVLFAFTNSLPAYTPAQALRRWDGAHTGPLGGRHGLYNLLRAARNAGQPVTLLDLKTPGSLAALDYVGGLKLVREMAAAQLLILPENLPTFPTQAQPGSLTPLPAWALERTALESRQVTLDFGLPASPFLFATAESALVEASAARARLIFIPQPADEANPGQTVIARWGETRGISVPGYGASVDPNQATLDGPSLEVRRALVETALAAEAGQQPLLVLGGDLPASQWGNPQIARATFRYLASRPWIQALNANDLLSAQTAANRAPFPHAQTPLLEHSPMVEALREAPGNSPGTAAWQAYRSLFNPVHPAPPELPALRAHYLGQTGALLAAARWADCIGEACRAAPAVDCSLDVDFDGRQECSLSSGDFFALLDPQGGALRYAFARTSSGVHQLVAPSSQFVTGLSDPGRWDLSQGLAADPDVITGAFAGPDIPFIPSTEAGELIFTAPDGSLRKSFRLTSQGLYVGYQAGRGAHTTVQIPLALDPWGRFSAGWAGRYQSGTTNLGWFYEVQPSPPGGSTLRVEIQTSGRLTAHSFNDSRQFLDVPEDPNRDYPRGHFLPFPMTLVEVQAEGDFYVQINVVK